MNVALWIVQILLALMMLFHGWMMITTTTPMSQPGMAYVTAIPPAFRRFIGIAEVLAGIGLVLPALTGILPWLTPLAAAGLVIVLIAAIIFHIPRKEYTNIVLNLILLALALFIAYGRFVAVPL